MPQPGPIKIQASINVVKETEQLRQEVAAIVDLPEKMPDLLFFSGVMVSSGQNLNDAYFLPSELVKAHKTFTNKPLDVEHGEEDIVGHIYSSDFFDHDGNKLDINELLEMEESTLNEMNIDVVIGGVVYKNRFPDLAREIASNKWKLSMETYYQDYKIKVGGIIMTKDEAESLGLASEKVVGKKVKILKDKTEVAAGEVARVLLDLLFSGCGIVKKPANPRSLILEVAKDVTLLDGDNNIEVIFDGEEDTSLSEAANSDVDSETPGNVQVVIDTDDRFEANRSEESTYVPDTDTIRELITSRIDYHEKNKSRDVLLRNLKNLIR